MFPRTIEIAASRIEATNADPNTKRTTVRKALSPAARG
jgi:hypothetical protein